MNKIVRDVFTPAPAVEYASLSLEEFSREIETTMIGFSKTVSQLQRVQELKTRVQGGMSQSIALESCVDVPELLVNGLRSYSVEVSKTNHEVAMEAVAAKESSLMDKIRAFIQKIIAFARDLFNRIKHFVDSFFAVGAANKRSLDATQLLLNQAIQKAKSPQVAQEGFSTGTIPVPAPKYLHLEYQRIVAETQKLEQLATAFIGSTVALLNLQFKHCKYVIEAYNKLMNSPTGSLEEFDRTCQDVVQRITHEAHAFHTDMKVFDCIEIVEAAEKSMYSGVLKYRISIKAPSQEEAAVEQANYTTNLMKAQDLQDRLVKLNDHIVDFAKKIKDFFVVNSKNFLDSLNKLNDSALRSKDGTFVAHSPYITQVHGFLVRGNLIQVVLGLNVLNNVWKSVHGLNSRVVKEFLNS